MRDKKLSASDAELVAARREFETRLAGLRRTMDRKAGIRPRRSGWWMMLVAGAVGMALAGRSHARREIGER